jgi:hypothetical protein
LVLQSPCGIGRSEGRIGLLRADNQSLAAARFAGKKLISKRFNVGKRFYSLDRRMDLT